MPKHQLTAARSVPDRVQVDHDRIVVIPLDERHDDLPNQLIEPLKGNFRRDWLVEHAYHCLPLVIGSQYGFIVKALYDFWADWDGGETPESTRVRVREKDLALRNQQSVKSHFGAGIVTIQNRWVFRTAPGINLVTIAPPNFYIDGITHLMGVVETDNLRRDFTLNLKITRPNFEVFIARGTPIGCVIPYPRHFIDSFELLEAKDVLDPEVIEAERATARLFGAERKIYDVHNPNRNGGRYRRGEDIYGNKFTDHQTRLDDREQDDTAGS